MDYWQEQQLMKELDRKSILLDEALSDVDKLAEENGMLGEAIEFLYGEFHMLLPHLAEKVRDENATLRRVLQ